MKAEIQYRGWAGHFICSDKCLFRLNTLITHGDIRIVVSTVGLMRSHDGKYESLGGDHRYYETMAWHAKLVHLKYGDIWDMDVERDVSFESPWFWPNIEDELKAQAGHEAVVAEIAARLEAEDE